MTISKKILDKVYDELIAEFNIKEGSEKFKTFDEIETSIEKFGREFERRALEKSLEMQQEKKKRHAKAATRKLKIRDCGKG